MANMTDAFSGSVSAELITLMNSLVTKMVYDATAPTTVTTGAIPVTSPLTFISIDGTKTYTLADGLYEGQVKMLRCTVAANTPAGTITPAHKSGFTSVAMNAVNDLAIMEWHTAATGTIGWRLIGSLSLTIT